jgi:N-ethylmaleimide reductase
VPTDDLHGLYYETALHQQVLIITEGAQVSLDAIGYINTAGIHTDEQVEGWKKSNQACFMIKVGKSLFNCMWDVCLILIFITGHYHYLRQLSIPNDKAFTPEGFKVTVTQGK